MSVALGDLALLASPELLELLEQAQEPVWRALREALAEVGARSAV